MTANLVTGTAGWAYSVDAALFATTRGVADGIHLFGNDGPLSVATVAAPGTGSRIDIIYALQPSNTENADANSVPVVLCVNGNATTGTPVPPAIPAGGYELARNTISSTATSTSSSGNALTQSWRYTGLRGAPIFVRNQAERDELTTLASAANPITVDRLDTGCSSGTRARGGCGSTVPAPCSRLRRPLPTSARRQGTRTRASLVRTCH